MTDSARIQKLVQAVISGETYGPWQIWTKYESDVEWELELVPESVRATSPSSFTVWSQVLKWFQYLEEEIKFSNLQIRIELHADTAKPDTSAAEPEVNPTPETWNGTSTP